MNQKTLAQVIDRFKQNSPIKFLIVAGFILILQQVSTEVLSKGLIENEWLQLITRSVNALLTILLTVTGSRTYNFINNDANQDLQHTEDSE